MGTRPLFLPMPFNVGTIPATRENNLKPQTRVDHEPNSKDYASAGDQICLRYLWTL